MELLFILSDVCINFYFSSSHGFHEDVSIGNAKDANMQSWNFIFITKVTHCFADAPDINDFISASVSPTTTKIHGRPRWKNSMHWC